MANMNILNQSPSELFNEQHYASLNQPEYQPTHQFRLLETPDLDRLGIMPDTETPSTYTLTAMESIGYDTRAEAELPCFLPDWNDLQGSFEYDWGEDWTPYTECTPSLMHSDDYSTIEVFSLLTNQETDGMLSEVFLQPTLQEATCDTTAIPASWNRLIPVSSSPQAMITESSSSYASDALPAMPPSTAPSPSNTIYTCETCDKKYPKQCLLTRHIKRHVRPHHCPVKSCKHRTAEHRDMYRHVDVHHPDHMQTPKISSVPRNRCPVAGCKYARRGFTRQDNLRRHLLRKHPGQLP